ncbi:biotin synthase BioB [Kocuria marina]|uniref:Biotin synthase n=1 Tax=Kocuria marina subsp. indica TaxID=1049583 RepID=A0A1X7DW13_9MICC|nr:biotin synthase BioB [Kocuria indica]OXS81206.1 biotin synthase BioB [Kocuria indica]RLP57036.1 biotin synthase BioB [Kocuria indica]SMF22726.1 biotin synthase [Kocuria indica]
MFKNPAELAERVLAGDPVTPDEALELLHTDDPGMLDLVAAAARLRREHFGMTVKVNYLVNLKSGLCAEDCGYCSQRLNAGTDILKYSWLSPEKAVEQAEYGIRGGASRVCLVASGRGPSNREVGNVTRTVEALKEQHPDVEVCACLGLLKDGQAETLSGAGVDAYNHNLNTAESHYESICSTHTYQDRVDTVERAKDAGLSPCSGLIVGMRETDEQLVEALFALRDLGSDSVPVNFLMPFEGTPLAGTWQLDPRKCLAILAVVRFVCPDKEIRMAGGREMHLRSLQPLALHVVNSLFLGDYLTSEGQAAQADLDMIADAGFTVLGAGPDSSREHGDAVPADPSNRAAPARTGQAGQAGPASTPCGSTCGTGGAAGPDAASGGGPAPFDPVSPDQGDGAAVPSAAQGPVPTQSAAPVSAALAALSSSGDGPERDEDDTRVRIELSPTVRRRGAGTEVAPNA